ncbi:MAG: hypothetical protein RR933_02130, partial [Oscillospiraceae bacterium]
GCRKAKSHTAVGIQRYHGHRKIAPAEYSLETRIGTGLLHSASIYCRISRDARHKNNSKHRRTEHDCVFGTAEKRP